jgi:hypothetical protein
VARECVRTHARVLVLVRVLVQKVVVVDAVGVAEAEASVGGLVPPGCAGAGAL